MSEAGPIVLLVLGVLIALNAVAIIRLRRAQPKKALEDEGVEYPKLFRAADEDAERNRGTHFLLLFLESGLAIATAILGAFVGSSFLKDPPLLAVAAPALATILFVLIVLVLPRKVGQYDQRWFSGRKLAESVKSETWRFVMEVDPYRPLTGATGASDMFRDKLVDLYRQEDKRLRGLSVPEGFSQPTDHMQEVRAWPLDKRLQLYRKHRLTNQVDWYSSRSKRFRRLANWWDVATYGSQIGAILLPILYLSLDALRDFEPVGVVTTFAAASRSWSNARNYRELTEPYGDASADLRALRDKGEDFTRKEDIDKWVMDVEHAISREHRQWVVRRLPEVEAERGAMSE